MLIVFLIAFLVAALGTDLGYQGTADAFWARASLWLVGDGLVTGGLVAIFGLIDFLTIPRVRMCMARWIHFLGNAVVLVLAVVSLLLRVNDPVAAVHSLGAYSLRPSPLCFWW
jgi:uncharacterized membrane protein